MTRTRLLAGALSLVAAAPVAAWSLAYPDGSPATVLVRTLADCAAVVTLGLAAVPLLETGRYRGELSARATGPLAAAAAVWLVAELTRLVVTAAQTTAVPVMRLGLRTPVQFALDTTAGRSGLVSVAAAAVCLAAVQNGTAAARTLPVVVATVGVAAVGLAVRTVTGHLGESALGGIAVAVHALAAALWCGMLAALALTVRHRGQWARVLPRFSLWCVAALLAAGVFSAVVILDSPADLYATGYGRLLLAKMVLMLALIVVAWRNRSAWLPAARSHQISARASQARSLTELGIMAVALAMAAALAVTG
ncbi:MAG: Copper resistance protein [Mycobacterium sp.]|nr:Copper resistance protein [Mycobacterium sp.]